MSRRRRVDVDAYAQGVLAGDRTALGRAITLVESRRPEHAAQAQELLVRLLPHSGASHRVGITGVPGVGKSTFIDAFGTNLTAAGHRVAVLAVDPSSSRTGGSILGDKTRMDRLATDPAAFVRPSPTSGTLGGVARATRETIVVVEAAGYDVVLVETVGVGQSETVVAEMVDFFLVLMLAGAGDELQGIKKGILELADLVAVNKAEDDNAAAARVAAQDYTRALHLVTPPSELWQPPVLTCSGLRNEGLDTIWERIDEHRRTMVDAGRFEARRQGQQLRWMWSMVDERLMAALRAHPAVAAEVAGIEADVLAGRLTATLAAERLLSAFGLAAPGTTASRPAARETTASVERTAEGPQ
ncbi:MAG: methylmalonyl Co-A mutase-associated GTPase MeaB [Acidimicrobiia bacterium]|nr:methylmalonyl Co-A mutase-associated GTPase MeaB [Acidimicrobiia bacterium]